MYNRKFITMLWRGGMVVVVIFGGSVAMQSVNALFVNPTTSPGGGTTSLPLESSASVQKKIGSLIIGSLTTPYALCLNATPTNPASLTDDTKCITAWNDLQGLGSSTLLRLNQAVTSIAAPYSTIQPGYAYLSGVQTEANPTLSLSTSAATNGTAALVSEGLTVDNFAGYFFGKVAIKNLLSGSPGRICLNGTGTANDGSPSSIAGRYCISAWTDIVPAIADKLTLQSTGSMSVEYGNVGLGQTFTSSAVVLGDPTEIPLDVKCGDGMCSTFGSQPETVGNCPIDCAATVQPNLTLTYDANTTTVTGIVTPASLLPSGNVTILVVRSTDPNFNFIPQNGVVYPVGGSELYAVVYSGQHNQTAFSFGDTGNGLTAGKTYYYRAFEGNLYPRYGAVKTTQITTTGTPPTNDPPGGRIRVQ